MNHQTRSTFKNNFSYLLIFRFMLGTCALIAVSSCVTAMSDPGAEILKAKINKNPPSDGIVGMWHRDNATNPGTYTTTCLYKKDGTAYFHCGKIGNYNDFLDPWTDHDQVHNYEYYYQGGGVWELFYIDSFNKKWSAKKASLAEQHLIITDNSTGLSYLYKRLKN